MADPTVALGSSARAQEFEALRNEANALKVDNDTRFQLVLSRAQHLFEMSDAELAAELLVSRPTVNRWLNGRNLPHRAMRRPILDWIAKRASQKLRVRPEAAVARERV
jgi:transcriptional regulator with XRE-family HTH domain